MLEREFFTVKNIWYVLSMSVTWCVFYIFSTAEVKRHLADVNLSVSLFPVYRLKIKKQEDEKLIVTRKWTCLCTDPPENFLETLPPICQSQTLMQVRIDSTQKKKFWFLKPTIQINSSVLLQRQLNHLRMRTKVSFEAIKVAFIARIFILLQRSLRPIKNPCWEIFLFIFVTNLDRS